LAQNARNKWKNDHPNQDSRQIYIAASIGPFGAHLSDGSEYNGSYMNLFDIEVIREFHKKKILTLTQELGFDIILCETIPSIREAVLLVELTRELCPNIPTIISFSCKNEECICSGESFNDAILALKNYENIFALGVNCTAPNYILSLITKAKQILEDKIKIIVYPNSGEKWDQNSRSWKQVDTKITNFCTSWYKAGANIIGGCCRIGPDQIKEIKEILQRIED